MASTNGTHRRRRSVRGQVHDRRVRDVLLVALAASSGAIDAVSWLCLGKVFSAFMTGNLAFLGFRAAGVPGPSVPRVLAAVVAFGLGAFIAARFVAPTRGSGLLWPRRVTVVLGGVVAAHAAFLAVWIAVGGDPSDMARHGLIAISAFAMGMQTAAVFSLGVRAVFTTAATATYAVLMGDLSTPSSWSDRGRLAGVIIFLVIGAIAGAYAVEHARMWAPGVPLAISATVLAVAASSRQPVEHDAVLSVARPEVLAEER